MAALSHVSKHVGGLTTYQATLLGSHRAPSSVIDWEARITGEVVAVMSVAMSVVMVVVKLGGNGSGNGSGDC